MSASRHAVDETLDAGRIIVRVVDREGPSELRGRDALEEIDGVLQGVRHVVDLRPLGLAVEVLKEEHDAALLRVFNSSLQPVDRGLPAQPHIRREVIAAMHDDPFGLEARGEIDIGPQVLIQRAFSPQMGTARRPRAGRGRFRPLFQLVL